MGRWRWNDIPYTNVSNEFELKGTQVFKVYLNRKEHCFHSCFCLRSLLFPMFNNFYPPLPCRITLCHHISPRMNILPSFAWGKTMFRHLRRSPCKSTLQSSEAYFGEAAGGGTGDYHLTQNIYGCSNAEGNVIPILEAFTFVLTVCKLLNR